MAEVSRLLDPCNQFSAIVPFAAARDDCLVKIQATTPPSTGPLAAIYYRSILTLIFASRQV